MNKYTQKEIRVVQRLIERCLTYYLTREEAISTLYNYEPQFIRLVWQKLEEQNPEFFKAYSIRLALKKQIVMFNELISQQAASMKQPITTNNANSQYHFLLSDIYSTDPVPFHGQTQGTQSMLNQQGFGVEQSGLIQQSFSQQQAPNQYNQQFPNQFGQVQQNMFMNQNQPFGNTGDIQTSKQSQTSWDGKNMWTQQTPSSFASMAPFSPTSMLNQMSPIPQSPTSTGNNMNIYSQQKTFGSQENLDQFTQMNTTGPNQQNRYMQMFQAHQSRNASINQQEIKNTMNQKETEEITLPKKAKVKSLTVNTSKKKKTSTTDLSTPSLITPTGLTPNLTTPTSLPTPLTLSTPQDTSSQLRHDFLVTPTTPTSGQSNGNLFSRDSNIMNQLDQNQLNDTNTDLLNDKQFYDDFAGVLGNQSNDNHSNDGALFD